jgi:hypothetical protein
MQLNTRRFTALIGGVGLGLAMAGARAAEPVVADADVVAGVWQHHTLKISYFGFTSHYTCYGLEDHVRDILVHLGARKDAKVSATGCFRGPDVPSPSAWVNMDFYTLAPAASDAAATDTVKAYWAKRDIGPRRPFFMDDGDCELIEQLKTPISNNFSLKDVDYRTDCVPHQINLNGFSIKAQALVAVPVPKAAALKPSARTQG